MSYISRKKILLIESKELGSHMMVVKQGNTTLTIGRAKSIAPLLVPVALLDLLLFLVPIIVFFRYGFSTYIPGRTFTDNWTINSAIRVMGSRFYRSVIYRTLVTALISSIFTLFIALPAALALRRLKQRFREFLISLLVYPFMVGGVIRSLGWVALLGENGPVNRVLQQLRFITKPVKILNTNFAVILGIVSIELPLLIIIVSAALESVNSELEQASLNLGASELVTMLRITIPLAAPGIGSGTILVFIQSMNTYVSSRLLGGPTLPMMSTTIYDELTSTMDWPRGAVLSMVLIALTMTVTLVSSIIFTPRYLRKTKR